MSEFYNAMLLSWADDRLSELRKAARATAVLSQPLPAGAQRSWTRGALNRLGIVLVDLGLRLQHTGLETVRRP